MNRRQSALSSVSILAIVTVAGGLSAAPKKPPKDPKPATTEEGAPFDRAAASTALAGIDLAKCKSTNAPRGDGHILVKFTPTGSAAEATVDKGPLMGTPVAKCVAKAFKKAKVPAFSGDVVQVGKSFHFE